MCIPNERNFFNRNVRRACGGIDSPEIPNLYGPILASCHQPFSLAMKRYRGDIRRMALESGDLCYSLEKRASENSRRSNYGSGRRAGNLVYVNFLMNCGSQQTLAVRARIMVPDRVETGIHADALGGDCKSVYLLCSLEVRAEWWIGDD